MTELAEGQPAPDFILPRNGGESVRLSDFSGKPVVVYFYPKDNTSGCTVEATDFTALRDDFAAIGTEVIGISPDPVRSHDRFAEKHSLTITLASDEDTSVAQAFGTWKEKSMYGKKYMGIERSTFLIAPDGTIARIWNKVKVKGHAQEVLEAAGELHKSGAS